MVVLALFTQTWCGFQAQPASGPPAPPPGKQWKLVWADEFDGAEIDTAKWNLPGDYVPRNTGAWSNRQIELRDGVIRFRAALVDGKVESAAINSEDHLELVNGYFEMRAALPRSAGYRPAFWISAKNINNVDDPTHPTEIDVMEYPVRNSHVTVNLHWNGYGAEHQTTGSVMSPIATPPGEFHTYGVWWSTTEYRFYVDGHLIWKSRGGGISTCPEFMKLGNDIFETIDPENEVQPLQPDDDFLVDYVRVYQME